jgi:carbon monoxide dehydrogenase subunit G
VELTNTFSVAEPVDRAWAVITDLERVAPCLPGAALLGVDGDDGGRGQGEGRAEVLVVTDLELAGRVAQFRRGVIADVSGKLIGQFACRLEEEMGLDHGPARILLTPVKQT